MEVTTIQVDPLPKRESRAFSAEHIGRRALAYNQHVIHDSEICAVTEDGLFVCLDNPPGLFGRKRLPDWYRSEDVHLIS